MNKQILRAMALAFLMTSVSLTAQDANDPFSDDSLFGTSGDEASDQEASSDVFSDDSLFESSDDVFGESSGEDDFGGLVEEISSDAVSTAVTDLLESDAVILGGAFTVSTAIDLYDDPGNVTAELSSRIFLDARPSSDFGVYIKGDLSYDPVDGTDVSLREMFADTNVDEVVFLRVGKQAVNWGVGYFYSPANVINLESIDPENPEEELLGPVALRAQIPLGTTNFYGYAVLEDFDGSIEPKFAALGQFLVGNVEVSMGGVYQWDEPWSGILTATGSLGDVSLFGEAVIEGDVDKTFVVIDDSATFGVTVEAAEGLYYSATAGFNYLWTSDDDLLSVMLLGQYYYNGLGYSDITVLTDNTIGVGALMSSEDLSVSDLMSRGQHYGAAMLSLSDVYDSGFSPSVFWMGSLTDGSGLVRTGLSYSGLDNLSLSISWSRSYGEEGMEYSPGGSADAVSLSMSFADSSF